VEAAWPAAAVEAAWPAGVPALALALAGAGAAEEEPPRLRRLF